MRVIVTGSAPRNGTGGFDRPDVVAECLSILAHEAAREGETELVVVHGCADGPDTYADEWVRHGEHPWELAVTAERHPANWSRYGSSGEFKRDCEIVRSGADVALVFRCEVCHPSDTVTRLAEEAEIPTQVIRYEELPEAVTTDA